MRHSRTARVIVASCALLLLVLVLAGTGPAQPLSGAGLVRDVDAGRSTVTIETRAGLRSVLVPPAATIQDDHGRAMTLGDIRPGDAVTYRMVAGTVGRLHVARQFWAIPEEADARP